jgi:hypothetical protein
MAKIHNIKPVDDAEAAEMRRAGDVFARAWLAYLQATTAIQKQAAEGEEEEGFTGEQLDAQMDARMDAQGEALWALIRVPSHALWAVKHKLEVLMQLLNESPWMDHREFMLVASVIRDIDILDKKLVPQEAANG